jgi:hypothetical protein
MPFGLTNSPSIFQGIMNEVFKPFLRKFVLVFFHFFFFNDILIYSKTVEEHGDHLKKVLLVLQSYQLYAKKSKYRFGVNEIGYLGHFISKQGVRTDPSKIEAMSNWSPLTTIKSLKGFLGLTGYYQKFIRGCGVIAAPLTTLVKKKMLLSGVKMPLRPSKPLSM